MEVRTSAKNWMRRDDRMSDKRAIMGEIRFEPSMAGGGSLWTGDNLLATLVVRRAANRLGHMNLRPSHRTLDLDRAPSETRYVYRIQEGILRLGQAEWMPGWHVAKLTYGGQEFDLGLNGLFASGPDGKRVIAYTPSSGWDAAQSMFRLAPEADLPLLGLYIYVVQDLRQGRLY